jgi:hypothetical protein
MRQFEDDDENEDENDDVMRNDNLQSCPIFLGGCFRIRLLFAVLQLPLDPRVRDQPEERDEDVQSGGNPWTNKREWDSGEIKHKREFTFPLPANGLRQKGVATFPGNDSALENNISDSSHQ